MKENIIFLDFDGVFITESSEAKAKEIDDPIDWHNLDLPWIPRSFDIELLGNIKTLQDIANAKIIISSARRTYHSLPLLKKWLYEKGNIDPDSVIGITPYADDCRGWEIRDWLIANPVKNYLIIDDDYTVTAFCPLNDPHWVHTKKSLGFNKEKLEEALQKIKMWET